MGQITVEDKGTRLRVNVSEGITGLTSVIFLIRKPNKGTTASAVGSTESITNGIVYYDTITSTFTEEGVYGVRARFNFSDGDRFHSVTELIRIYA